MKKSNPPSVQLSLMVEPAVGKYLTHTHPGQYVVNVKHPLGSWIVNALAPKNTLNRVDMETVWFKERAEMLTYEYKFAVPVWYLNRVGTYISAQKMVYFNRFVLNLMYTELMMNIVYHHGFRAEDMIQDCIVDFRSKYDIFEKEFPDERLRKKYLRLRKRYAANQNFASVFKPGELLWKM